MRLSSTDEQGIRRSLAGVVAFACVLAGLTGAGPGPASAAAATGSSGSPSVIVRVHQTFGPPLTYFDVHARPGTIVHPGSIEVINPGSRPVVVQLKKVDGTTTDTLGSGYGLTATPGGPATWTRLSAHHLVIPAGGQRTVAVSVDVPSSAQPGDVLSGIAVEALDTGYQTSAGGLSITEIDRYAIGVEVQLPGPREASIQFTGARAERYPAELTFLLDARNEGNVILKNVSGQATVSTSGHVVASIPLGPGTFVTNTSIAYPVGTPGQEPAAGTRYRVRAVLHYEGGVARLDRIVTFGRAAAAVQQRYAPAAASSSGGASGAPAWAVVVVAAVALLLIAGACALVARRRRRSLRGRPAWAHLEGCLRTASDSEPVSIVRVETTASSARERRLAARLATDRMRGADGLCDLGPDGLVLVLPAADARTAAALALDLGAALTRAGLRNAGEALPAATATAPASAVELIACCAPVPSVRTPA